MFQKLLNEMLLQVFASAKQKNIILGILPLLQVFSPATQKNVILGILILLLSQTLYAQDNRVLVANNRYFGKSIVSVRFYPAELTPKNGANIYRQEGKNADWKKMNTKPMQFGDYQIPEFLFQFDTLLAKFAKGGRFPEKIEGIAKAFLLMQLIQKEELARLAGLQFDDSTIVAGKSYRYRVMRLDANGKESPINVSESITAGDPVRPTKIENLKVRKIGKLAQFHWKFDTQKFFAYHVYRTEYGGNKEHRNEAPILISKVTEASTGASIYPDYFFTDSIHKKHSYQYYVTGIDYFGHESEFSDPFDLHGKDEEPPAAPSELKYSQNEKQTQAELQWKTIPSEDDDLKGFRVYRSQNRKGKYEFLNDTLLDKNATVFSDKPKTAGDHYYYVLAIDEAGNAQSSDTVTIHYADRTPPAIPQGLSAKADIGKITIQWQANPDKDLLGYRVYRGTSAKTEDAVLLFASVITVPSYTDSLFQNIDNHFFYRIVAYDSVGNQSKKSDPVAAQMPDVHAPEKPHIKYIAAKDRKILIDWYANVENDLKTYQLYRAEGNADFKLLQSVTAKTLHFEDDSIRSDIEYHYYLEALDSAGNISEKSEVYDGLVAHFTDLPSIKELFANYDKNTKKLRIEWKIDHQKDLLGFMVYRQTENSEEGLHPLSDLISTTYYSDTELKEGFTYFYQVRIFSAQGAVAKSALLQVKVTTE